MPVVERANPHYTGASTQGYYVIGGDGQPVLWDNYPARLAMFLERGLSMYRGSPARKSYPRPEDISAAKPLKAPDDASIVRLFNRIRPLPAGASAMNALLGRDYMWILSGEVKEMIAAARSSGGGELAMPSTLAARLVIFHLVDNVRGIVWPWQPSSVEKGRFSMKLVRTNGKIMTLSFTGEYAKKDAHPPQWTSRGQEGKLDGELDIDTAEARVTRFRALAESTAWSDATYDRNSPPPSGRYPIVTAIVEATDPLAREIAPEQAVTGAAYLRPSF